MDTRPRGRHQNIGARHHRTRHRTLRPDKTAELILYCGGGYRSALACDNLQRMGYTNVHSMAGGWKAWEAAGLTVTDAR
jgi:rhodanese-related sulfurtransferase